MRVYRVYYKDKNGKKKQVKKWWIELRDHLQITRRFPAFTDKAQSGLLGRQIERLVNYKVAGEQLNPQLTRWLEQIPEKLRNKLVKAGLLDTKRAAAGKSLSEHLEDFKKAILAKGSTKKHATQTISRVKRIFDECKFKTWTDISASKVQYAVSGLRKYVKTKAGLKDLGEISAQTYNHYLKHVKEFCKWMVDDRRASESPVKHLQTISVSADRRHDRRSLEADEIRRLLEATKAAPKRFGMDGHQRALLYRLAVETGLRRDELKSLKKSSFDFENYTVTVEAAYSKNRRQSTLPLRKDTAAELRSVVAGKLPNAQVFKVPEKTANMLKADLEAVGIPYVDDAGRYADFHALRHSTGSLLAASGVHPKVVQSIMRHSDINMTMSRYTHIFRGQESEAVAGLPDFSLPSKEKQKTVATGTDGKNLAHNLAFGSGKQHTAMDFSGQKADDSVNCQHLDKPALIAENSGFPANKQCFETVAPVAQLDRASVYGTEG
jgi:integrase